MGKKVGLFGGTFDPVHKGHISIARAFLESGYIEELWILLTPYPPHKQDDKKSSYEIRFQMLEAAFGGLEGVSISAIEDQLPKPSYTVQTVRYLKKEHPGIKFYFCMGEDSLAKFHTWKFYREIIEECELLVAHRPGASHQSVEKIILNHTHFVDHSPVDISSSTIKQRIKEDRPVNEFLPDKVLAIIDKNQLYR